MDFLANYGIFLAKAITVVLAIVAILSAIAASASKAKGKDQGKLTIKDLNDHYNETKTFIDETVLSKEELKADKKLAKANKKEKAKENTKNRLYVINFIGDIKASAVSALREEITAVLLSAKPNDEVLVRLDSPGGMVNTYGLAASQLQRIKDANLKLTVAVDKVAASGGYMMACVADHIVAAPFAVIGSIGVVAQLPNFHRYLEKHHIDFEQITAGEYKRTLTMFGENTSKGRHKMQEDIDDIHTLFKSFIQQHREQVNLEQVSTGEYWYGIRALGLNLVDELKTSDDYLLKAKEAYDIYEIQYKFKKSFSKKLNAAANMLISNLIYKSQISTKDDL